MNYSDTGPRPSVPSEVHGDANTASTGTMRMPLTHLPPGTRLGGFELSEIVGQGGMATVYRAVQLSLNRPVAVKILATAFAYDPISLKRFETEAGALAGLSHPNIVNIIDRGTENNLSYYAMELVEGITLDQLIYNVNLNDEHYRHVISEISNALTYVHERGIIHRDIKPSNVLVTRDGIIKVSDFGIAHWAHEEAPKSRTGRSIGTLNYMAPELGDNPTHVDVTADVYALAVTFYKMMTRQLPSHPGSKVSAINPEVPPGIDEAIIRGMHPDPARRFPSVRELCDELLTALQISTAEVHPAGVLALNSHDISIVENLLAGSKDPNDATSSLVLPPFMFDTGDIPTPIGVARVEREMLEPEPKTWSARRIWFMWIAAAIVLSACMGVAVYLLYFF